jgi:hypothetical protein
MWTGLCRWRALPILLSQKVRAARSPIDAFRETHVYLSVASIFVAMNVSPAIVAPAALAGARSDTSYVISIDSTPVRSTNTDTSSALAVSRDSLLATTATADTTTRSGRPRAIEYSDAYHTRLKIHQIGAYAMLPLFISEYFIGQKLLTSTNRSRSLKSAHSLIAGTLGVVFASNTVTGVWNFWDARTDPNGRVRREIHSVIMLASDVGMVASAMSAGKAKKSLVAARRHRTIAISSIALSAVGTGMMWLWRN